MSGGASVSTSFNLGAYAGRLDNLNLMGIKNPSPNLTTVYLDTPLVGPAPEPLEYVSSPGLLSQPSGYTPRSTRTSVGGAWQRPPPQPPPHNTHPHMLPSTDQAQPRRRLQEPGPEKSQKFQPHGGNPSWNFGQRGWRGLTPPRTLTSTGGGNDMAGGATEEVTGPEKNWVLENRREPLAKGLTPPGTPTGTGGVTGTGLWGPRGLLRPQKIWKIWQIGGNPWKKFGRQGQGVVDTCLNHPHPSARLDVFPPHPLHHTAPCQGSGFHKGMWDSRHSLHQPRASRP